VDWDAGAEFGAVVLGVLVLRNGGEWRGNLGAGLEGDALQRGAEGVDGYDCVAEHGDVDFAELLVVWGAGVGCLIVRRIRQEWRGTDRRSIHV